MPKRAATVFAALLIVMLGAQGALAQVALPWDFSFDICCRIPESTHFNVGNPSIAVTSKAGTGCNDSTYNITVKRPKWGTDAKQGTARYTEGVEQTFVWKNLDVANTEYYLEIWRTDFHRCGNLKGSGTVEQR